MIRSSLCDHSDAYILVKGTIIVPNTAAAGTTVNNMNKKVILKHCAPCSNYKTEINNTEVDDAQDINIVMPMYNSIKYTYGYSNTSGSLSSVKQSDPAHFLKVSR